MFYPLMKRRSPWLVGAVFVFVLVRIGTVTPPVRFGPDALSAIATLSGVAIVSSVVGLALTALWVGIELLLRRL